MNDALEQILLSEELLAVMRNAARNAQRLREPFISTRSLLLGLLEDPTIGPVLVDVLPKERLLVMPAAEDSRAGASRVAEPNMAPGERAAMQRFDTLAFKLPDGKGSMWLSNDALQVFMEGAQRSDGKYLPKHLAFGIAAEAVRTPGILQQLRVEPGKVTEAIFSLG